MFTASLGKNDGDKSIFELKGLPPLKLNSGHGGYFDGYIASITDWEEMSLTPNFDNIRAIASGAAIQQHEPLRTIQKGSLALIQQLRFSNNILAWARVVVEERKDPAHAEVYFIDIGVRERVSVRNLYDMPAELRRFPPQVFPVRMFRSSSVPDLVHDEFYKLTQIRITVQIKSMDGSQFVCDHFTVYDAKNHGDIEIGEALRSGIEMERYNTTDVLTFQYQPLVDGYHRKDTEMIGILVGSRTRKPIHLAVFLIFLLAAVFLVTMFVAWRYDGILSRKKTMGDANMKENEDQLQRYKESQACSPSQSWNTQAITESNLQIPNNPNPKNWNEPISETFSQSKTKKVVIPLSPSTIASVAAIIGISAAIKDKGSKTIHVTSQATNEQCISDTNQLYAPIGQLGSGLSAISSIHPSSNFLKATSSTPYNLPQARISNKESPVSASRASPFNSQEALTYRLPTNTADYSKTYGHLMTNTMKMQDVDLEGYSELQLPTYMDIEKMLVERDSIKRSGCNTTQSTQNIDHYKSTDEDHNGTDLPEVADRNLTIDSFYSVYSNMLKSPKQKAAVVNLGPMYE